LVLQHLDLVRRIAYYTLRHLPRGIEVDDLIQTGMVGLLEAADRYECRNGSTFATYATGRIRGAILDSLRLSDWGPRSMRRRLRDIDAAKLRIEQQTGASAKAPDIATSIGMTLDIYFRTVQDVSQSTQMSLDAPAPLGVTQVYADLADSRAGPPEELEQEELTCAIAAAIGLLPAHERVILLLYYDRELLMRDIGIKFGLSESRICQIHKRTIERLRVATQS
jgi:RNA polymerase sigma factor FliA